MQEVGGERAEIVFPMGSAQRVAFRRGGPCQNWYRYRCRHWDSDDGWNENEKAFVFDGLSKNFYAVAVLVAFAAFVDVVVFQNCGC